MGKPDNLYAGKASIADFFLIRISCSYPRPAGRRWLFFLQSGGGGSNSVGVGSGSNFVLNGSAQQKETGKEKFGRGIYRGDNIFIETFEHFQSGLGRDFDVDASSLDFSKVSQKNLTDLGNGKFGLDLYKCRPCKPNSSCFR